MDGTAKREAGFPGDAFSFEVFPEPGHSEADIAWSGGGTPATGTGRRFTTRYDKGGSYTVTATSGGATTSFAVEVCPVDEWLDRARAFYGPAIDFSKVRVKASALVAGGAGYGWTCNDVIRFKRPRTASEFPQEHTLIHELGHVWEHQSGQAQLLRGFVEQVGRVVFRRDPYDFGGPKGVQPPVKALARFRKEGQAEIIRDYWLSQHGFDSDMKDVPFATDGYVKDLRQLVEDAGIGTRATAGRSVAAAVDRAVAWLVNAILR